MTAETPPPTPQVAAPFEPAPRPVAEYHQALRGGGAWRGIVAIVAFLAGFFVLSLILTIPALVFDVATGVTTVDALMRAEIAITPALFLANNLSLAALIPLSMLLQWAIFGVRPRFMSSVTGGFRWRWLGRLAVVIVPVWAVYTVISLLVDGLEPIRLDGTVIAMTVIILFTTPLQSAGEEYGARGLLQRAAGSWFANPTVAFLVSTALSAAFFALAHLAGDPWLIAYYVAFAVASSLSARWSGGLEASVLVHAVNNTLLLVPVALMGQTDRAFERQEGVAGPFMLLPIAVVFAVPLFVRWWARRHGVARVAPLPPRRGEVVAAPPGFPAPPTAPPPPIEPPASGFPRV